MTGLALIIFNNNIPVFYILNFFFFSVRFKIRVNLFWKLNYLFLFALWFFASFGLLLLPQCIGDDLILNIQQD